MLAAMRNFFSRKPEPDPIILSEDNGFTIVDGEDFDLEDFLIIDDEKPARKSLNFNRITDNIFLGSCLGTKEEVEQLKAAGVTAVLNLQTDFDFLKKEIDWEQLVEYYEAAGIEWKRNPTIDYNEDDLKNKVPLSLLWVNFFIKQGHVVYVHCNSGVNRSPTVVAAYLHLQGMSIQSAINQVLARRTSWPDKEAIQIGCRIYKWHSHKIMLSEEQKKQIIENLSVNSLDFESDDVDTFIARCREVLIEEIEGGML